MDKTVSESIRTISHDVRQIFDDLMKSVLRKTLRPTISPFNKSNGVEKYNPKTKKYDTLIFHSNPDFGVSKYNYTMVLECIGWCGDSITTMKAVSRTVPMNPTGAIKVRSTRIIRNRTLYSSREQKDIREKKIQLSMSSTEYRRFIEFISGKNMQNIIANKQSSFAYTCDVSYMDCFKQLYNVGTDILTEIDPDGDNGTSTLGLRKKLDALESTLFDLYENNQSIYCSFIDMVYIINSVDRKQLHLMVKLIAALSYQSWDEMDAATQDMYLKGLGCEFISRFNSNQLITILLQDETSELIITSSYIYSLLKMLFCVFGYTEVAPSQTINCDNLTYECSSDVKTCDFERVAYFQELYPSIVCIISNTDCIPISCSPECCDDIPETYDDLCGINDYFWRYAAFSNCSVMKYNAEKQMELSLNAKVDSRVQYFKNL